MEENAPFGNRHTGIPKLTNGPFMAAKGPLSATLKTRPFELSQRRVLRFCCFKATAKAELRVVAQTEQGFEEVRLFSLILYFIYLSGQFTYFIF